MDFFAHPFWVWIAIGGVFLVGELLSGSGWLLWPAGAAALVAVVNAFVKVEWPYQVVIFLVVGVAFTYLGRRFLPPAPKHHGDINDPAHRLVGQPGDVVGGFHGGQGRVFVDGKEWAAELEGGGDLGADAKVTVTQILTGARLRVKPA